MQIDVEIGFTLRRRRRGVEHGAGGCRETARPLTIKTWYESFKRTARIATVPIRWRRFRCSRMSRPASGRRPGARDRRADMPPWPASSSFGGPFRDARVLTDDEIATLQSWVDAKCPEGDPKDAPEPRTFSSDWPLGEPDLILTMPEPYNVAATGDDDFRVFVLKTNFPEDRWIRAVDFHPGNRSVVHHIIAGVDPSGRGRELDAADPGPGYHDLGGFGDGVPITAFLPIWTPGAKPRYCPDGTGYMLPKGADILIQVHYHKTGKPETDATAVGLYLSKKPLPRQVHTGFVFPNLSMRQAMAAAAEGRGREEGREAHRNPRVTPRVCHGDSRRVAEL